MSEDHQRPPGVVFQSYISFRVELYRGRGLWGSTGWVPWHQRLRARAIDYSRRFFDWLAERDALADRADQLR